MVHNASRYYSKNSPADAAVTQSVNAVSRVGNWTRRRLNSQRKRWRGAGVVVRVTGVHRGDGVAAETQRIAGECGGSVAHSNGGAQQRCTVLELHRAGSLASAASDMN